MTTTTSQSLLDLAISYQIALIVPSTYTTTSVTLSLSHHGKLPRPFEQEAQKNVSLRLQLFPWNRE